MILLPLIISSISIERILVSLFIKLHRTANFTSNYEFDDEDFARALKDDEEDLDEIVRKCEEARYFSG